MANKLLNTKYRRAQTEITHLRKLIANTNAILSDDGVALEHASVDDYRKKISDYLNRSMVMMYELKNDKLVFSREE